jgi:hypothetical protein
MYIKDFSNFNQISLITERLHINREMDEYSDKIYHIISQSDKLYFEFNDLPSKLNITKLFINIKNLTPGLSGQLDLNKSKNTKSGWEIYLDLKKDFNLYTLKHELNHALRLTLLGKDKMIKNLNHIKAQNIFLNNKSSEIDYFFYLMYLANDEEINSKVMETNGLIKEVMIKLGVSTLNKDEFIYLIESSDAFKQANDLIKFKCDILFKKYKENDINKLFYILEENKSELDRIYSSKFSKLKLIIKVFKDIFTKNITLDDSDRRIYNPNRGKDFYDKWVPSQGEKLKRRIYSLFDHYS